MMKDTLVGGAVAPSSGKRGHGSGIDSNRNKDGSKRYRSIAKSIIGEISSKSENGLKRNSVSRTLEVQRQRWWPRGQKQSAYNKTPRKMMLKSWESLREVVHLNSFIPPCRQGPLRELCQNPLQEGTGIPKWTIEIRRMKTSNFSPHPCLTKMTSILVMLKL